MATVNFVWGLTKSYFTLGLIGLTVSNCYASIVPVGGISFSMSPTFNPYDDMEKLCLQKIQLLPRRCGCLQIPLGLVRGKVTHVVWPPQRVAKVERITPKSLTPF